MKIAKHKLLIYILLIFAILLSVIGASYALYNIITNSASVTVQIDMPNTTDKPKFTYSKANGPLTLTVTDADLSIDKIGTTVSSNNQSLNVRLTYTKSITCKYNVYYNPINKTSKTGITLEICDDLEYFKNYSTLVQNSVHQTVWDVSAFQSKTLLYSNVPIATNEQREWIATLRFTNTSSDQSGLAGTVATGTITFEPTECR